MGGINGEGGGSNVLAEGGRVVLDPDLVGTGRQARSSCPAARLSVRLSKPDSDKLSG
jgi:hypothetical protein